MSQYVKSYLFVLKKPCLTNINITLQGEGVAYRGRLLVELETKLGEEIDKELEVMKGPELIRIQVVLNCKKTPLKIKLNKTVI